MENLNEYKKFLSFTYDKNDKNNPIKPTNYINSNFDYKVDTLSAVFNSDLACEYVHGKVVNKDEVMPILQLIIEKYEESENLYTALYSLGDSYLRNLDKYHLDLISKAIKYGKYKNNIFYSICKLEDFINGNQISDELVKSIIISRMQKYLVGILDALMYEDKKAYNIYSTDTDNYRLLMNLKIYS